MRARHRSTNEQAWINQTQTVNDVHVALEIDNDGCVLVRPDGHVAARFRSLESAMSNALPTALGYVFGRTVSAAG